MYLIDLIKNPLWDKKKASIILESRGAFSGLPSAFGLPLPDIWWAVFEDDEQVGYGWLSHDIKDDIYEVSIAISKSYQGKGLARMLLNSIIEFSRAKGIDKLYAVIRFENPLREEVVDAFVSLGFSAEGYMNISGIKSLFHAGVNGMLYLSVE